ncbi:MAG TPA: hypothetical protein VMJ32_13540 [Pirellulales bacterium]|nr:hypothetical protein [Pirellulales bacterium]
MPNAPQTAKAAKSDAADIAQLAESVEALRQEVARLTERTAALEKLAAAGKTPPPTAAANPPPRKELKQQHDALTDELVIAISAAIAAYLGVQPHIRQIRLLHSHPWGQQGRVTIQASHRIAVQR